MRNNVYKRHFFISQLVPGVAYYLNVKPIINFYAYQLIQLKLCMCPGFIGFVYQDFFF